MSKYLLSTFVCLLFASVSFAQPTLDNQPSYHIKGQIKDATTEAPISASITLKSLPYGDEMYVMDSEDSTGAFTIKNTHAEKFSIHVEKKGYFSEDDTIFSKDPSDWEIALFPSQKETVMRYQINFRQGSAVLPDDAIPQMDSLVNLLAAHPDMHIRLEGHTDFHGGAAANMRLSENRVKEIKRYLVSQGNINEDRISIKAYGGTRPLSRKNTPEARKMNRRVEVRIMSPVTKPEN